MSILQIWLRGSGNTLRLPVLPPEYSVTGKQNNTVVTVNGFGEVLLKGRRGLFEVSFSCFFPKKYNSSYCEYRGYPSPSSCVHMLNQMKEEGHVKLVITGVPVSLYAEIEEFTWGENDATGDICYSLTLREDRKPSIPVSVLTMEQTAQGSAESSNAGRSEPETKAPTTYTVKSGDCLSAIARKLTGSANWKALYEQNKGVIGSNPNLIYPGQVLVIPGG